MRSMAKFVTGHRTKWLVLLGWVVLVVALRPLSGKLGDATDDRTESALPADAQSTTVLTTLKREFASGQTANGLIVYQRDGGLTAADRRKIDADALRATISLPVVGPPSLPFRRNPVASQISHGGDIAYTLLTVPNNEKKLPDWGKELRGITATSGGALNVYVTGDLGASADFEEVFASFDTKLLLVTAALVLVLLLAIYRSPVIALLPLLVVGFAYSVGQAFVYLLANSGQTVNSQTTTILVVLMFGVGTDYCLLLVSRYREELRRSEDKHDAMARALRRAGPAILASGLTVVLTMLVLVVAKVGWVRSLGPASAIGVGCAFLAGLTLLPALLTIVGRRGFWPRRRLVDFAPGSISQERQGAWRRIGDRVLKRPLPALATILALFVVGSFGLLAYKEDYSTTNTFRKKTESVEGFKVLKTAFPAGALAPADVIVERDNGPVRPSDVATTRRRLISVPSVAEVTPPLENSSNEHATRLGLVLSQDPYTKAAFDAVPNLRDRVADVAPGVHALIGGGSATQYDFNHALGRDIKVIIPITLLVIAVILGILLRAIVAPLVLIGSVIVSFFGTLGIALVFFRYVVGENGADATLPIIAYIFLVALGIDYTIFLMSRVREESRRHGTREGTLRALGATGTVITSAGLILAGTFSVLMTLPVWFMFNIGFLVALGILLDTFVVRTIMVPAAIELLGDRIWWPSTAKRGRWALRKGATPPQQTTGTEPAHARRIADPVARAAARSPRPRAVDDRGGGAPRVGAHRSRHSA